MQDPLLVLVVEDDGLIQHLAEETLTDGGFKVRAASCATEALAVLDEKSMQYRPM